MLKKVVLSSMAMATLSSIGGSLLIQTSTVADSVNPVSTTLQTQTITNSHSLKVTNGLNVNSEWGFDWLFNPSDYIASFDATTNTIVYQNGIVGLSAGGATYDVNDLYGVIKTSTSGGVETFQTIRLTSGNIVGNSFTGHLMNYTYKLSDAEKEKFDYYIVDVQYHDDFNGGRGSAQAIFTID